MILIFHGDDIKTSRNTFIAAKQKSKDVFVRAGDTLTLTDLTQLFEGGDLFGTEKNLFIDEFFSKRRPSREIEQIIALLNNANGNITIWESKEIPKKSLSQFPKALIQQFKLPQSLFQLVDNLRPQNGELLVKLFHESLIALEPEQIFAMILRQLRILLALSSQPASNQIDEVSRLAPWQKGKLQKQATYFSEGKLQKLYQKMLSIDTAAKTGGSPLSMTQHIDFLLVSL